MSGKQYVTVLREELQKEKVGRHKNKEDAAVLQRDNKQQSKGTIKIAEASRSVKAQQTKSQEGALYLRNVAGVRRAEPRPDPLSPTPCSSSCC